MSDAPAPTSGHPILRYTAARFGLLLAVGALFYVLGFRDLMLIVLAFIGSGIVSFFLLDRSRGEVGLRMSAYFRRMNDRIDSGAKSEDEIIAQAEAEPGSEVAAEADEGKPATRVSG